MTLVNVDNDPERTALAGEERRSQTAPRTRVAEAGGQGGVALPAPSERLARRHLRSDERAAVWWLGAHGGAGESTLEELFSGSRAADHRWPLTPGDLPPARVALVARTHSHGLHCAQCAIREWAAGDVEVLLFGLVLIADAPGRLPRGLRQLADLIAGGVPAVWSIPWVEAWRTGEPPAADNAPDVMRRLLSDLQAMAEIPATADVNRKDF